MRKSRCWKLENQCYIYIIATLAIFFIKNSAKKFFIKNPVKGFL